MTGTPSVCPAELPLASGRSVCGTLPALLMGILNATPDSFWEGSRVDSYAGGIEKALALVEDGADILDIGGESTRPGASYVSASEEIDRILPLIEGIRRYSTVPISVDTRKSVVLEAALKSGADILNDISALEDDPRIASVAALYQIPVILMHKQGTPETMQLQPRYDDTVRDIRTYLLERAEYACRAGILPDRIILDPGIGFGKRHEDNCALLMELAQITHTGYPVLVALSRKSLIGRLTGRETGDRLAGTLAANLLAVQRGARILRVHDVAATRDTLAVLSALAGA